MILVLREMFSLGEIIIIMLMDIFVKDLAVQLLILGGVLVFRIIKWLMAVRSTRITDLSFSQLMGRTGAADHDLISLIKGLST